MWYKTEEEAEKACRWKEKQFNEPFVVLKDSLEEIRYWAQRKSSLVQNTPQSPINDRGCVKTPSPISP